jgi:hypothetical protein
MPCALTGGRGTIMACALEPNRIVAVGIPGAHALTSLRLRFALRIVTMRRAALTPCPLSKRLEEGWRGVPG